jgi:aspartate/methionine/tyrosine aminotransferase
VLYHALVGPGDHVIVETPCYESGLEVARSTGAQVSEWRRTFESGWAHDVTALEKLIRPNTKVIYINTPHNPTGLLMPWGHLATCPIFRLDGALPCSRVWVN